ncbi:hypothetical protein [Mesorhizobium sp. ANAO-SY3R2]|uniref:hypothetical protein n=1 Tax=Mesorhizobium sp. ANAO-SY3R2 TaxID=3166644 RepID=UPI00366FC652
MSRASAHVVRIDERPAKRGESTGAGHRVILSRPGETLRIEQAAHHATRNTKTIRRWCFLYGIGRQAGPNAPLEIHRVALDMVLHGDFDALELLRQGRRDHEDVARYFDLAGLPI